MPEERLPEENFHVEYKEGETKNGKDRSLGESKQLQFIRQSVREQRTAQRGNTRGLQRAVLKSWLSIAQHIHLKKSPYTGKRTTGKDKREQRTLLGDCTKLKIFPILTSQSRT